MRLLKRISILLVLALMLSMLAGCGNVPKATTGNTDDNNSTEDTTPVDTNDGNGETSETYGEGQELTAFVDTYIKAKQPIYDALTEETGSDLNMMMAWLGIMGTDMTIAFVPMFDTVELMGGSLFLTAVDNAYKRTNGDTIEFGYDFTYTSENATDGYPAGSHTTFLGYYNTAKGSLKFETIDDNGSGDPTRTVVEICKNSSDSYTSQFITYSASKVEGYFTFFEGENFISYTCSKADGVEFSYNTIYEMNNPTIDFMKNGFDVVSSIKYENGEATYETMTE